MSQRANTTLALAALALAGTWLVSGGSAEPTPSTPPPTPVAEVARLQPPAPTTGHTIPSVGGHPAPDAWLTLSKPLSPRRLPSRPHSCTSPPPGGTWQVSIIEATRKRECAEALQAWSRGMEDSEDHCTLARAVWLCFSETNQRRLEGRSVREFDELVPWLVYLEGRPETQAALARALGQEQAPPWSWPAAGGLEYRLDAFSADPVLQETVIDLFGEPTVTDHLANDLLLEAEIAAALARVPATDRYPYLEEVWARRVYVVASALYGRPGELLQAHRKDLYPELRRLVAEAVEEAPETVRKAYAVARRDEALK